MCSTIKLLYHDCITPSPITPTSMTKHNEREKTNIIRNSQITKPLPLTFPPDPSNPSPSKAWVGRKLKDMPQLESLIEAMSLLAWDIAWVLWTQQLWPPVPSREEALEACHLGRNLYHLVSSSKIGGISHASTIEFLPTEEVLGRLPL